MPYMKEVCVAGKTVEIRKYYNFHTPPPGEHRGVKKNPTPERIRNANRRKAETDLRRLMNANLTDADYSLTLTYRAGEAPASVDDMRRDAASYARRLSKLYKAAGIQFKYIYCMGAGPHRRHIHITVNNFPDMGKISDAWDKGHVSMTKLYTKGNYAALAAYYIKNAEETRAEEIAEGLKPRRRFNSSHNLIKPKVKREKIPAKEFRKEPRGLKGYQIIKDLTSYGISEITGMPYLSYTLLRDEEDAGNKLIYRHRAERKCSGRWACSIPPGSSP